MGDACWVVSYDGIAGGTHFLDMEGDVRYILPCHESNSVTTMAILHKFPNYRTGGGMVLGCKTQMSTLAAPTAVPLVECV
jgi:hypothetical protein